nr:hypothetical protein [Tanacetum cinerariifolium]
ALVAYEVTRAANALEAENQNQNGSDGDNGNGGDGNSRNGNGGNRNGGKTQMRIIGVLGIALTWWNSHKRTIRANAAFSMSWRKLMRLMAEVYCPRIEIQKMESKL